MKTLLSSRRRRYLAGLGILFLAVALVVGMTACGTTPVTDPEPDPEPDPDPVYYALSISSTEGGAVTTPGEGLSTHQDGAVVYLVAESEDGYSFVEWTGDVDTVDDVNAAETTITMQGDYSITANFFQGDLIWDWYDLHAIRDNLDGNYLLMADLDSMTAGYEEYGESWEPIGTFPDHPFTGDFDGQGYEISNLVTCVWVETDVGLFGLVGEAGVIQNVGVVDATVRGGLAVGSLVGYNLGGTVSDSYSTGNVTDYPYIGHHIGGLIGMNDGTVSNSWFSGEVNGYENVGGLVGFNEGSVSSSYSSGNVDGADKVGGLVGMNHHGTVTNSYSEASVLVWDNGSGYGGFVGVNFQGKIINCYSTGEVTSAWYPEWVHKGFAGYVDEGGGYEMTGNFWDSESSGQKDTAGGAIGKHTDEMQDFDTFDEAEWDIVLMQDYLDETWYIDDGNDYPRLGWQSQD